MLSVAKRNEASQEILHYTSFRNASGTLREQNDIEHFFLWSSLKSANSVDQRQSCSFLIFVNNYYFLGISVHNNDYRVCLQWLLKRLEKSKSILIFPRPGIFPLFVKTNYIKSFLLYYCAIEVWKTHLLIIGTSRTIKCGKPNLYFWLCIWYGCVKQIFGMVNFQYTAA